MMNEKFTSIFIGNNSVNLFGCENDALLFYNLPLFQNKNILLGDDATVKNLEKIFRNNMDTTDLFIFFSGHGFRGGCLKLYDVILKPSKLYDLINHIFVHPINLYMILDCCYSGSFPQVKNFNKIKNNYIIASSDKNEKSSESMVLFEEKLFIENKPKVKNNHIVIGLFSHNFIKMLYSKNLKELESIFLSFSEKEWNELQKITNQNITIKN